MTEAAELIERLRCMSKYKAVSDPHDALGDGFRSICVKAADHIETLEARVAKLSAALEPFVDFARNVDEDGWKSNIHRESISTWFGPSDFREAKEANP